MALVGGFGLHGKWPGPRAELLDVTFFTSAAQFRQHMKKIIELNESNFDRTITESDLPVVVDFYAPWCGPCKMLAPFLDALAVEFADRIQFTKVNVDVAPGLAQRYGITGVPTLIICKAGRVLDTMVGMPSPHAFKVRLEELALTATPATV